MPRPDQRRCVSDLLSIELGRLTARRLLDHPEVVLAQAWENLATMRAAHVDGSVDRWLDEWERLLNGPVSRVVEVLTADDESARQLRQNTPFAGVVPARERHELIENDLGFCALLLGAGFLDPTILLQRIAATDVPDAVREKAAALVSGHSA